MTICPVCNMEVGKPWGGTTPCRERWAGDAESHRTYKADLKSKGCPVLADAVNLIGDRTSLGWPTRGQPIERDR